MDDSTLFFQHWPIQDYVYEYEDNDNLLESFSVDLFADGEIRDALQLNGDVKRIHKIRFELILS